MKISEKRYRDLLEAEHDRDAVVDALGAAWLELHAWLNLAAPLQQGGRHDRGAAWAATDGAVRGLEHTLAIVTNTFVDRARATAPA